MILSRDRIPLHLSEKLPSTQPKRRQQAKKNSHEKAVDQECNGPLPESSEFQAIELAQQLRLTRGENLHRLEYKFDLGIALARSDNGQP
jgi:hypothetical protein